MIMMSKLIMIMAIMQLVNVIMGIKLVSKVIMMSKGSIGNFLADEQPLPLGQEIIRFC